ncbi:MmyB family transcriptional regulator, partial [Streptomyces rubiginosohelvolus]
GRTAGRRRHAHRAAGPGRPLGPGRRPRGDGRGPAGRTSAQGLRAAAARYPDDPEVTELVAELRSGSEEFARLWDSHDVSAQPTLCKTLRHPLVGPITVNCDVLDIADRDQRVTIYTAEPGSPSQEGLHLLATWAATQEAAPHTERSAVS